MSFKTNRKRLWNSLMEMAKIGPGKRGGNCRLALTDSDVEARKLFQKWAVAADCSLRIDSMGNLFARREGKNQNAPPVMSGSHLDTQPSGGKFDGVLGVLGALEVLRTLNDSSIETEVPIEIVVWTNEEGARFSPAMMGSGVFTGVFDQSKVYTHQDKKGKTVEQELKRTKQLGETTCKIFPIKAYYELHIEQGPVLENNKLDIGVVTGGQGSYWTNITLYGQSSHAGTTPMKYRKDPIMGASKIISKFRELVLNQAEAVATIGRFETHPSSINTIPERVFFTVDSRHPNENILEKINQDLKKLVLEVSLEENLESNFTNIWKTPSINFDEGCISVVKNSTESLGYSFCEIVSGAGHDACHLSNVVPSGMIFIPCEGGLSHDEAENTNPEQVSAGADVLLNSILTSSKS